MNTLAHPPRPLPALTLTIKTAGAPAVHLGYDLERPIQESGVTVLDQGRVTGPWSFEDVVKGAVAFLFLYMCEECRWPAELRAPCAGRRKADEAS